MTIEFGPRKSWLRLALLFQSHRQAMSWFATLAFTLVLLYFVSDWLGLNGMPSYMLVSSVALGSAFSLIFALPFRLRLTPGDANLEKIMRQSIEAAGYKLNARAYNAEGKTFYAQLGPKFLTWEESDVAVSKNDSQLTIDGPFLVLWKLRSVARKSH